MVQDGETDLNFVSRTLEDIASGHFAADDYDFQKPRALLGTRQQQPAGHPEDSRELYAWPGGYTELGDGESYARVRIEQQQAQRETVQGEGNARRIAPGYLFALAQYPRADQNKDYLIESAYYRFEENIRRSDGAGGTGAAKRGGMDSPTTYRISFTAVPQSTAYRSQRITPKPHTSGPQTAVVTGPAGEEIYTDKYGRVKVQFHWDRLGKKDENSSCWLRVSSPWAGSNYGGIHIPRIGQEVIVDFIGGDPDYPIITGRVYNAEQMPPWELPANKTQSGFLTRSTKGGTPGPGMRDSPGTANAIRFEDKAGEEQLWLHAQVLLQQSGEHFELACGAAKIVLRADGGIYLQGTHLEVAFSNAINMDSAGVDINCGKAQTAPPAPPAPPPAPPPPAGLDGLMDSLGSATDGIKGALGVVQQLQGLVQTAKAIKSGDVGAIAGALGGAVGAGAPGSGAGASPALSGRTPGWNPNA